MPVMDGFDATKFIRQNNTTVPIIALTATAIESIHMKCKEVGMNSIITKPIDTLALVRELDRWLAPSYVQKTSQCFPTASNILYI